jgi:hypothetical protein
LGAPETVKTSIIDETVHMRSAKSFHEKAG